MATDTCQYCVHFYVEKKKTYMGVSVSVVEEKWCILFPQWVPKDFGTRACGQFEKIMPREI